MIAVYDALAASGRVNPSPFNVFALHPYPSGEYRAGTGELLLNPYDYMARDEGMGPTIIHKFMAEMSTNGYDNKPIWITEMGWNSAKGSSKSENCSAINQILVSSTTQAVYLENGFNMLFQRTAWDWQTSPSLLPSVTKVFVYQYRDTGAIKDCNAASSANSAYVSSSWYDSYLARYVFPDALNQEVDWWFGLYDGNDVPLPKFSQCIYRLYPAPNAVRVCFGLVYDLFLPVVEANVVTAAGQ